MAELRHGAHALGSRHLAGQIVTDHETGVWGDDLGFPRAVVTKVSGRTAVLPSWTRSGIACCTRRGLGLVCRGSRVNRGMRRRRVGSAPRREGVWALTSARPGSSSTDATVCRGGGGSIQAAVMFRSVFRASSMSGFAPPHTPPSFVGASYHMSTHLRVVVCPVISS